MKVCFLDIRIEAKLIEFSINELILLKRHTMYFLDENSKHISKNDDDLLNNKTDIIINNSREDEDIVIILEKMKTLLII